MRTCTSQRFVADDFGCAIATICRRFYWPLQHFVDSFGPDCACLLRRFVADSHGCAIATSRRRFSGCPIASPSWRLATDSLHCAIAHTSFFHHPFGQCACPILRATAIFYISFVLKRAAQACAVPASPLAPMGSNPHLLTPGHYSIIFAPTGDIHY